MIFFVVLAISAIPIFAASINCTAELLTCNEANANCIKPALPKNDLLALCQCNSRARTCFEKLIPSCDAAKNLTELYTSLCESTKCGPQCDGAPYMNCELEKIANCSMQAGVCQAAQNANQCACLDTMRSCAGDSQLTKCDFYKSIFPRFYAECKANNCSSQCGAVAGCDFEKALKCGDAPACTADAASCGCLQAKHDCIAPLAKSCDILRAAIGDDLERACSLNQCSTSCNRAGSTCVAGSLILSSKETDTCNSCTCKDGKPTSCTRKRCAQQCKDVTECRAKRQICVKDVKMCIVAPCPQYRCIDPNAPEARNEDNFDGDEIDESATSGSSSPITNSITLFVIVFSLSAYFA